MALRQGGGASVHVHGVQSPHFHCIIAKRRPAVNQWQSLMPPQWDPRNTHRQPSALIVSRQQEEELRLMRAEQVAAEQVAAEHALELRREVRNLPPDHHGRRPGRPLMGHRDGVHTISVRRTGQLGAG
jgi:hypothetical protein